MKSIIKSILHGARMSVAFVALFLMTQIFKLLRLDALAHNISVVSMVYFEDETTGEGAVKFELSWKLADYLRDFHNLYSKKDKLPTSEQIQTAIIEEKGTLGTPMSKAEQNKIYKRILDDLKENPLSDEFKLLNFIGEPSDCICPKCGETLFFDEMPETKYQFICPQCDEQFFGFEAQIK